MPKRKRNEKAMPESSRAVPPPDNPLLRHEADVDAVGGAEAAALRAEAIRRTRMMPSDDQPPPDKK
jgi:hypothetical protein